MYPLTMRQAPGLPGSWTGDAGARLPPAQKAGLAPEIALEKDPSSEQVDWRALLDSNQWPSASELTKPPRARPELGYHGIVLFFAPGEHDVFRVVAKDGVEHGDVSPFPKDE